MNYSLWNVSTEKNNKELQLEFILHQCLIQRRRKQNAADDECLQILARNHMGSHTHTHTQRSKVSSNLREATFILTQGFWNSSFELKFMMEKVLLCHLALSLLLHLFRNISCSFSQKQRPVIPLLKTLQQIPVATFFQSTSTYTWHLLCTISFMCHPLSLSTGQEENNWLPQGHCNNIFLVIQGIRQATFTSPLFQTLKNPPSTHQWQSSPAMCFLLSNDGFICCMNPSPLF